MQVGIWGPDSIECMDHSEGGVWGSTAVCILSENSCILVPWPVPSTGMTTTMCLVEKTHPELWNYSIVSISCSKSQLFSSQNLQNRFLDWKWHTLPPPWNFSENSSNLVAWPVPKCSEYDYRFCKSVMHVIFPKKALIIYTYYLGCRWLLYCPELLQVSKYIVQFFALISC